MSKKILIVDDDDQIVRLLSEFVSSWGYETLTACRGAHALKTVSKEKGDIDLIILDVNMPDMDGFETLKRLKKDKKLSSIPVIFLTGNTAEEDMAKGMQLYAQCYLTKPLEPERLHSLLKTLLSLPKS